jgi:cytidylate kinase
MRVKPVVAIDGPAAAGKSTVSRLVAERLNYTLLDSGALYRAVALAAFRAGLIDDQAIGALAHQLADRVAIRIERQNGEQTVWLDDEDVTHAIREQRIGVEASKISAIPEVRAALLDVQRALGREGGLSAEGRDIGTVVFPDAEVKVFLTASVEERARRRHDELLRRGSVPPSLDQVCQEIRERDARDSARAVSPLRPAADAQVVDTTDMPVESVVCLIVSRVQETESRLARGNHV